MELIKWIEPGRQRSNENELEHGIYILNLKCISQIDITFSPLRCAPCWLCT